MNNRYKVADIENLRNELGLLPEADRESRQIGLKDVMKLLVPVLREMRDRRGYTNEQLLAILRDKGVEIGKSTLNDYLKTKRRPAPGSRPAAEPPSNRPAHRQGPASALPAASASSADKESAAPPAVRAPLPQPPRTAAGPAPRSQT